MQPNYTKAALGALILLALMVSSWEVSWRARGFTPSFNDDKALWAEERKQVYQPMESTTVFIGSSRIKFDLDIPTWEKITGEKAVQLSLVGTSPILLLKDLAEDESFKGKLVIDVTEPLFFSQNPAFHKSSREAVKYFHSQTLAEKAGSKINLVMENNLAFLEERKFALNALLNDLQLENRPGVFSFPSFPKGFEITNRDRQTYMSEQFLNNEKDVKKQTDIWTYLIMGDKTPPADGAVLDSILQEIRNYTDRIRSRGGKIIFVRTPSSGVMGEGEQKFFPREKYWNAILQTTNSDGIHFLDYESTKGLVCPEWSHLSVEQARFYTRELFKILSDKKWFTTN
jgi:hypothetical protein